MADWRWHKGWLSGITPLPSPNFGPRPIHADIDLIVIHSISLPPGRYGTGLVQAFFTNTLDSQADPYFQSIADLQVSSHFFIERTGQVWQFVSCDDRAWHAGASSYRGRSNCNDDSIGVELEGLENGHFEPVQYESLGLLCRAIAMAYPIAHVAGHEHVAPGRKQDPGPHFDWGQLQERLAWPSSFFP
jgi:N-acetyl-anhydromuramoyl-L-alanine amidase